MKKNIFLATIIFLFATSNAMASDRFISRLKLSSGQTAVISEGEFEARSIGSFTVRLYQAAQVGDETTFYTSGFITSRDGFIEKVVLDDINGDTQPEIIVVVRSAGSGGYLSAYAITIDNNQKLLLDSMVEGLAAEADPVLTLKNIKPH